MKRYIDFTNEKEENNILKKIAPVPNSKGVMVVEITKIVRDLQMLKNTIKQAKFYKVLINENQQNIFNEDTISNENEQSVSVYRQLLNEFFLLIVRLNNGVEEMSKQSETYKLKLLNSDLRSRLHDIKQE